MVQAWELSQATARPTFLLIHTQCGAGSLLPSWMLEPREAQRPREPVRKALEVLYLLTSLLSWLPCGLVSFLVIFFLVLALIFGFRS